MANVFSGDRYNIDTVGFSVTNSRKIKSVAWDGTGLTAGTDRWRIIDPVDSHVLAESRATGTTVVEHRLIESWWENGFTVDILDGGLLVIELM